MAGLFAGSGRRMLIVSCCRRSCSTERRSRYVLWRETRGVVSFTMLSLRIASIGFVFLRLVCYFMYTGGGVVCVSAGLSERWRVRSPPPHVFKIVIVCRHVWFIPGGCFKLFSLYTPALISLLSPHPRGDPFSNSHPHKARWASSGSCFLLASCTVWE